VYQLIEHHVNSGNLPSAQQVLDFLVPLLEQHPQMRLPELHNDIVATFPNSQRVYVTTMALAAFHLIRSHRDELEDILRQRAAVAALHLQAQQALAQYQLLLQQLPDSSVAPVSSANDQRLHDDQSPLDSDGVILLSDDDLHTI
jgi:hypothetical protein